MKTKALHFQSLVYGYLFNIFYWSAGSESKPTAFFLELYKNTRRKIPGTIDSRTGRSTRYGASEAHATTQR